MSMLALTVWQPWTWAIAYGGKPVENRGRRAPHRGLLAIHAGLQIDPPGCFPDNNAGRAAQELFVQAGGYDGLWDARFPPAGQPHPGLARGAVIAVADLYDCHRHDVGGDGCGYDGDGLLPDGRCSAWATAGSWHWRLRDVRPLAEPVIARGLQGLWPLPEAVEAQVRAELRKVTTWPR